MKPLELKISNPLKQIKQPAKVKNNFTPEEKRKLAKTSLDFESMLTRMMLKSMTKSVGGLFGENNYGGDVFDTIFENELATYMSEAKSFGVAGKIYEKLTGEKLDINKLRFTKINVKNSLKNEIMRKAKKVGAKQNKIAEFEHIILEASKKYGVESELIKSVILAESGGNPKAVSKANAKGLMQLTDATAEYLGVKNVWDPRENIFAGTKYLALMLRQYNGNKDLALAAYNAGPGNVKKYKGIPPFTETKTYINRVKHYLNNLSSS